LKPQVLGSRESSRLSRNVDTAFEAMEGTWELRTDREMRRQPLYALAALLSLCTFGLLIGKSFFGLSLSSEPLILAGAVAWLLTFLEVRIGFALLIFTIALSPEFTFYGVPNIRLEDFLFPAVFTAWLVRALAERQRLVSTDLKIPVLLLILVSLVSSLQNLIYGDLPLLASLFRLGKATEYYLMFFVALNLPRTSRDAKAFIHLLWIAALAVALYTIVQYNVFGQVVRASGPPGETANILGGYLLFHTTILLGMGCSSARMRRISLIAAALMLVPFVYTFSRSTYVAFFVAMVVLSLVARDRTATFIMFAGLGLLVLTQARDRFATIFGIFSDNPPSSWEARVNCWRLFLPQALDAPLLGYGLGKAPLWVDNEYVRQIYELGLAGFVLFIVVVWRAARTALNVGRNASSRIFRGFAFGYLAGLVGLLVHALAATSFTTIRTTEPFFIATGLLYAISARTFRRPAEEAEAPSLLSAKKPEPSAL